MFNIETLRSKSDLELTKILKDLGVKSPKNANGNDLIFSILDFQASNPTVTKAYYNSTTETEPEKEKEPLETPKKITEKGFLHQNLK